MKATMVLTPLALAMAAVLSVSAYAGNEGGWHPPKPNPQSNNKGGATALVVDTQQNYNNKVSNFGTLNNASVSGSIKDASGNVGVNVAAGDNNQQANAAALASADASFVFGTATASTSVLQSGYGNTLNNYSNPNTASLSNSANNVSGNLGVNVAAGNFNQQKNDLAAAVSNGQYSTAGSAASQTSTGNTTVNSANYAYGGTYVSLKLNADGSYKGTSDQIGDVYLDTWALSNWSQLKSMSRSVSRFSDASPLLSAVTVAVAVTPPTSTVTVNSVPGSAEMVRMLPTKDSTGVAGGMVSMVNGTGVDAVPPLMSAVTVEAPSGNGPMPPGGVRVRVRLPAAMSPAVRVWLTSAS